MWWYSLNNSTTCCCTSSGHCSILEKSNLLNSLSSLSGVNSSFEGNLWSSLFIPIFPYSGTSPCNYILCTYLSTLLSILMHGAKDGETILAALSHPMWLPFLMVTFSPKLLTKATATLLVPGFTIVYDSTACTSWKLPMFYIGSAVTFNLLENMGSHTMPIDFIAFLGWIVIFWDNLISWSIWSIMGGILPSNFSLVSLYFCTQNSHFPFFHQIS